MRLVAIYNAWDGIELLSGSIRSIIDHVDGVIIVYQSVSNFGEVYDPLPEINAAIAGINKPISLFQYKPLPSMGGTLNEREKRNLGLKIAIQKEYTHFLHMDCDEYYLDFGKAKREFIESGAEGSVCPLYTYFKKPTLRFENPDGYFVPFIHRLRKDSFAGRKPYPFYVDPTRRINETNVIKLSEYMHHYSWVRKDIERKARNSSAKSNLEAGTMLKDYFNENVGPGYYVKDYDQKLVEVENYFSINL